MAYDINTLNNKELDIRITCPKDMTFEETILGILVKRGDTKIIAVGAHVQCNIRYLCLGVDVTLRGSGRVYSYNADMITVNNKVYLTANNASAHVSITANDSSDVSAWENCHVSAYGYSHIELRNNSTCIAKQHSRVRAYDKSKVELHGSAIGEAYNSAEVDATLSSVVYAYGSTKVTAIDNASVYSYQDYDGSVLAKGASVVHAYTSGCKITATMFSTIYKENPLCKIVTTNHFGAVISQVFKIKRKTVVYKKLLGRCIATLQLEKGQVFQSEKFGKCRTDRALVVAIEDMYTHEPYDVGYSKHDSTFEYRVGKTVSTKYNPEIEECSTGIHFFLTRKEAENY